MRATRKRCKRCGDQAYFMVGFRVHHFSCDPCLEKLVEFIALLELLGYDYTSVKGITALR